MRSVIQSSDLRVLSHLNWNHCSYHRPQYPVIRTPKTVNFVSNFYKLFQQWYVSQGDAIVCLYFFYMRRDAVVADEILYYYIIFF